MKIRIFSIIALLSLLCGCAAPAAPDAEPAEGFTFTDDLGRSVTVNQPKRVASLLGSFAQIWQLAGGQAVAAPDDAWVDLGLDMAPDAVNLGSTKNLSLEALFAAEPDLVLAYHRHDAPDCHRSEQSRSLFVIRGYHQTKQSPNPKQSLGRLSLHPVAAALEFPESAPLW